MDAERIAELRERADTWPYSESAMAPEVRELLDEVERLGRLHACVRDVADGAGWAVQVGGALISQCDIYGRTEVHRHLEEARSEVEFARKACDGYRIERDEAEAERDEARAALDRVREALGRHPDPCPEYADDDVITCGWKRAVADLRHAIEGGGE